MAVSDKFRDSAYGPDIDTVWLVLATIEHADLSDHLRVVNNTEDIVSQGNTFTACPFEISLPDDTDDGPPGARVTIDNVSQEMTIALRTIDSPAQITFEVIDAAAPDDIEIEYADLTLRDIEIDVAQVRGTVGFDDARLESFPSHNFSPGFFPGAF